MKIKFNSDDDLPLKKYLKFCIMVIVARSVFHEGNKYYSQIFLDECLYKLKFDRTDMFEGINVKNQWFTRVYYF